MWREGKDSRGHTERKEKEVREGREGKGIIKSGLVQVYEHIVV